MYFRTITDCGTSDGSGFLVRPHQARVARHIGCEDCGETAEGGMTCPAIRSLNQVYPGTGANPSIP